MTSRNHAVVHLDDAVRRCDRLGAPLLAARARAERARALAARDHPAAAEGGRADGNVFRRGVPTPLNVHDWLALSKGAASGAFVFLKPERSA